MAYDQRRPDAGEIYERVAEDARAELERSVAGFAFSGLFGTIGLSAGVAIVSVLNAGRARSH
jgi:hypothetical protein